jgi:transposase
MRPGPTRWFGGWPQSSVLGSRRLICWSMSCCHGRCETAEQRYAGLTGSPDESGAQRREQGLARAGNARVRRGMIQLAWRFLMFQKESALTLWYRARTADSRSGTRKTMIVALARKLIIALWRFVTTGEPLEGVVLRPAS